MPDESLMDVFIETSKSESTEHSKDLLSTYSPICIEGLFFSKANPVSPNIYALALQCVYQGQLGVPRHVDM